MDYQMQYLFTLADMRSLFKGLIDNIMDPLRKPNVNAYLAVCHRSVCSMKWTLVVRIITTQIWAWLNDWNQADPITMDCVKKKE